MFRMKLSKFKQAFAVAFIPRILVRELRPVKNKFNNCTFDVFNKVGKSTDSGSNDESSEKQKQTIKKCFGENKSEKNYGSDERETPMEKEFNVRFSEANASDTEQPIGSSTEETTVKATTASLVDETLAQKVEKIDETPHVEACPKNIEGFNSAPKVMGHDIEFFANEKIQHIDLDDLAKRCVGAPIGNIDELLIKEMQNMSLKDVKSELDMNLVKGHCVEKYYSGIFEHLSQRSKELDDVKQKTDDNQLNDPMDLHFDDRIDAEMRTDRITPLHTDSLHLFAFDEGTRDFKESGFLRDSCMNFTSDVENIYKNHPDVITPYDSPSMPFYEYINKETIMHDDVNETIAETVAETEMEANLPAAEDSLLKEEASEVQGDKEIDPLQPEPNISHIIGQRRLPKRDHINYITNKIRKITQKEKIRPTVSNSTEPSVGNTIEIKDQITAENRRYPNLNEIKLNPSKIGKLSQVEMLKLIYVNPNPRVNKKKGSHVFSTPTEFTSGTDPFIPTTNSAISGTPDQEMSATIREGQHTIEMPENSAISANQNPGEYYSVGFLNKAMKFNYQPIQTLTAETFSNYSTFYTPLHQNDKSFKNDPESDTIQELGYPIDLRDPFSYAYFQGTPQNTVLGNLNDQMSQTTLDKITFSMRTDDFAIDDGVPLSQILKRIRDKNRLQFCRDLLMQCAKPTSKKLTCPPPLDRSKPRTTLYPRPCQPKPKPPDAKPQPCKPKSDPCAKLIPFLFSTLIKSDVAINIPLPIPTYKLYNYKDMVSDEIVERLRNLGKRLHFVKLDRDINFMKDANCARDFDPWIPIPSWPAPKVERRRPFVCPKEGCKQFPEPKFNPPKQNPCPGMPKKRFSFSEIDMPEILIN